MIHVITNKYTPQTHRKRLLFNSYNLITEAQPETVKTNGNKQADLIPSNMSKRFLNCEASIGWGST